MKKDSVIVGTGIRAGWDNHSATVVRRSWSNHSATVVRGGLLGNHSATVVRVAR
jgi:hypothetical protein